MVDIIGCVKLTKTEKKMIKLLTKNNSMLY